MTKEQLVIKYIEFVKKYKKYPKRDEFNKYADVSRDIVSSRIGSYEALKDLALNTKELDNIIFDVSKLSEDYVKQTKKVLSKYKRFVITTAVAGAPANRAFLASLHTYCKKEYAALIVIPSVVKGNDEKWHIDPEFRSTNIIMGDYSFNSNISILGLINNARSVDPISGLPRLGKKHGSFVCASPKQSMKVVPTGIQKLPHIMMSTGSVTLASYRTSEQMQTKQTLLADNDHVTGAVIVELDKDEMFHVRPIRADNRGGFADLGSYYNLKGKTNYSPAALVSGDWHVGETDPTVANAKFGLIKSLSIKRLIIHDLFDGKSLNPHEKDKLLLLAKRAEKGELNLNKELDMVAHDLKEMLKVVEEVRVVPSNHDEFLNRYLESGEYVKHPYNHKAALRLAMDLLEGKNPLEEEMRRKDVSNRVKFMIRDESYKIAGIELNQHGDRGQNGAKASLKGLEESYGPCIVGHGHSPKMERDAWMVGTSTYMDLGYNVGASSWLATDALVYDDGTRQMINYIDGKFTTRKL